MHYKEALRNYKRAYWETIIEKERVYGGRNPTYIPVWAVGQRAGMKYAACRRHLVIHGYTIRHGYIKNHPIVRTE